MSESRTENWDFTSYCMFFHFRHKIQHKNLSIWCHQSHLSYFETSFRKSWKPISSSTGKNLKSVKNERPVFKLALSLPEEAELLGTAFVPWSPSKLFCSFRIFCTFWNFRNFPSLFPANFSGRFFRPIFLTDFSGRFFRPFFPADFSGRFFRRSYET